LYIFRTESSINIESSLFLKQVEQAEQAAKKEEIEILEYKWKALKNRVYCYNCRVIYSATKKRKFGDEISINGVQRKRAGQTQ